MKWNCVTAEDRITVGYLHVTTVDFPLRDSIISIMMFCRDIAQAIKHLLDAVNEVFGHIHSMEEKNNLDKKKREFVKYSKKFSQTLKEFFKDNRWVMGIQT